MQTEDTRQFFTRDFYRFVLGFVLILGVALLLIGGITLYQTSQTQTATPSQMATTSDGQ